MSLSIGAAGMWSDRCAAAATWMPWANRWMIAGFPQLAGRLLSRNEAVTGLLLAEQIAAGRGRDLLAECFKSELGLADGP